MRPGGAWAPEEDSRLCPGHAWGQEGDSQVCPGHAWAPKKDSPVCPGGVWAPEEDSRVCPGDASVGTSHRGTAVDVLQPLVIVSLGSSGDRAPGSWRSEPPHAPILCSLRHIVCWESTSVCWESRIVCWEGSTYVLSAGGSLLHAGRPVLSARRAICTACWVSCGFVSRHPWAQWCFFASHCWAPYESGALGRYEALSPILCCLERLKGMDSCLSHPRPTDDLATCIMR